VKVAFKLALLLPLISLAFAQETQQQSSAAISGTVVDSVTGQGLKGVEVRAHNFSGGQAKPGAGSATTDAEGHFTLEQLAPGRYFVSAMRPGYVGQHVSGGGTNGRGVNVVPDQRIDVVVQLTPGSSISGHIKNADGQPLKGVSVEVVKYSVAGTEKSASSVNGPVWTNESGDYHITGLSSGRYYLRAIPPSNAADKADPPAKSPNPPTAKNPKPASAQLTYVPTYYPNSNVIADASPLTLRAGEDLPSVDITLTAVHALTVSGKIWIAGSSAPAADASLTLINNDTSTFQRDAATDAKGAFEFKQVPPGEYVLVARIEPEAQGGKILWGQRALRVADANVRNLECAIGEGGQVTGRVRLDDKAAIDLASINVALQPEGNPSVTALMPDVNGIPLQADGTFTFVHVPEGSYAIEFTNVPQGYFLKSASGGDVLETGFTISRTQSAPAIDLTLSANSAQLSGTVSNDQMPIAGASVVLLPLNSHILRSPFLRRSFTDQSGRFSIKGIVPGDYNVIALVGAERSALMDPDFVEQYLAQAKSVNLQEGGTMTVTLDAVAVDSQ